MLVADDYFPQEGAASAVVEAVGSGIASSMMDSATAQHHHPSPSVLDSVESTLVSLVSPSQLHNTPTTSSFTADAERVFAEYARTVPTLGTEDNGFQLSALRWPGSALYWCLASLLRMVCFVLLLCTTLWNSVLTKMGVQQWTVAIPDNSTAVAWIDSLISGTSTTHPAAAGSSLPPRNFAVGEWEWQLSTLEWLSSGIIVQQALSVLTAALFTLLFAVEKLRATLVSALQTFLHEIATSVFSSSSSSGLLGVLGGGTNGRLVLWDPDGGEWFYLCALIFFCAITVLLILLVYVRFRRYVGILSEMHCSEKVEGSKKR